MAFGSKIGIAKHQVLARIIAALRFRVSKAVRVPNVTEGEFIKITGNHAAYAEKLRQLGLQGASDEVRSNSIHVGMCWLHLAREHLVDADATLRAGRRRSTLSRSYYAAYNASKAVRYIVFGLVSLSGDDHGKASDLPDDFPSVAKWSATMTKLYENRLISDYDNWLSSSSDMSLSAQEAYDLASEFVQKSTEYLGAKIGAAR